MEVGTLLGRLDFTRVWDILYILNRTNIYCMWNQPYRSSQHVCKLDEKEALRQLLLALKKVRGCDQLVGDLCATHGTFVVQTLSSHCDIVSLCRDILATTYSWETSGKTWTVNQSHFQRFSFSWGQPVWIVPRAYFTEVCLSLWYRDIPRVVTHSAYMLWM